MTSRPLLDYLAYPDDIPQPQEVSAMAERPLESLEARLRDLELRLRAEQPAAPAVPKVPERDLTISGQIEAILNRRAAQRQTASRPAEAESAAFRRGGAHLDPVEESLRAARVSVGPPPTVPASNDLPAIDQDFLKFTEAVYLIGQAARRFIDEPRTRAEIAATPPANTAPSRVTMAPSTGEIEALSAVLRETVSAFRSVADDLAVSAGEIRHYATRPERQPEPSPQLPRPHPSRSRDDEEIEALRDGIADLQDRLEDLLHARRRARY